MNVLSELPYVRPNLLHTPDLLHGVYLGLLDHLMTWIEGLLKKYKRQNHFDEAWGSIAPYHGLTMSNKSYREVSQWSGKEMHTFGRIILSVLTATLSESKTSEQSQTPKQRIDMKDKKGTF